MSFLTTTGDHHPEDTRTLRGSKGQCHVFPYTTLPTQSMHTISPNPHPQHLSRLGKRTGYSRTFYCSMVSQIIAFWGSIYIRVNSSNRRHVITIGISAMASRGSVVRNCIHLYRALNRGDWTTFSGWEHGQTRLDVVLISWRTPLDLRPLSLQVAMQLESVAFGTSWEVLVCGRNLSETSQIPPKAYWIQSPRATNTAQPEPWIRGCRITRSPPNA